MRKNLFRHVALLAAAILSMASFWSCKKNELPDSIAVIGVSLDKTSITITVGSTETIKATIEPEDADNQNITWTSDNPEVATVNEKGKVTGGKDSYLQSNRKRQGNQCYGSKTKQDPNKHSCRRQ